ncbi:MAG: argininosuccinate lyase [Alphaproteobacteria bacterium]|nr:argininosuccinate lyase [Alphaproteobacteria bacterium]MBU0804937.1 argininosuccinate lyase [Alphaproteobacteria bacterium]MBU0870436.1 argininosuccinate lyase [Alphaproteobacteria bacterium]MBU1401889.1 argininosuccinate lyase [Alphaproteobacteria bacterium]MBU1591694.1 argininosuccinate lyase [Alphaproteobacteria bacterium]
MSEDKTSNQMWGGRFASGPAAIMQAINASISFDKALYAQDIQGSLAHSEMLAETGIIPGEDQEKIAHGLNTILREIEAGSFAFSEKLEDIHMNVEARLAALIGPAAGRLHTARSRNDQVAVDFRLWTKQECLRVAEALKGLIAAFLERAEEHAATVMPGFTHLQTAQPVTFGHHCMAYVEMFSRDLSRVRDAVERMDESPLGAAALAGTGFPIDRDMTAKALGFREPTRNSLDSVSDRDFALEFLSLSAICATHLSRLAEEIVIWSTPQFGFVRLSDQFSTGSSIMPQKKNPDAAELVRAKTGRINGDLIALLTVMKGLPLTYSKDMQEDKEAVFDAAETLDLMLAAMTGMVRDMTVETAAMKRAAGSGYSTATDLADWLVRELGMPFREAHHVTGRAVALAESRKSPLEKLGLADLQSIHPGITDGIFSVLSVKNSVNSRTSFGGTAPKEVRKQVRYWKKRLAKA